jgi:hypothetical protein
MTDPDYEITEFVFQGYTIIKFDVGRREVKRVVPPAGENYAFDVQKWARRIQVSISPTGRNVHIHVDGTEVARHDRTAVKHDSPLDNPGTLQEGSTAV